MITKRQSDINDAIRVLLVVFGWKGSLLLEYVAFNDSYLLDCNIHLKYLRIEEYYEFDGGRMNENIINEITKYILGLENQFKLYFGGIWG